MELCLKNVALIIKYAIKKGVVSKECGTHPLLLNGQTQGAKECTAEESLRQTGWGFVKEGFHILAEC